MAFNLQTFKTRALTAVIFVVVMFAGLFWNKWSFIILFTIIHFGCWYEFIKLLKKIYGDNYLSKSFSGIFYITMPVVMMLNLGLSGYIFTGNNANNGFQYSYLFPSAIIFSIWINDTMAYIVGSFIGKTPFSKISPKKTWEGTLGGAILCIIVIGLVVGPIIQSDLALDILMPDFKHYHWFIIAALCAIFGTAGDLLESKIKRMADVKDSGSIMPGHGGFLDRFDSLLIATPFVWLFVRLFI
jgi:phosphatidate cytidylyltransferase